MPAPPVAESPTAPPEARAVGEGGVGEGSAPPAEACAACGAGAVGPYCHACGERQPRPEDESLGAFLREQAHEVTSADGRMWRSLKALFVPGKLTEEYFAGRRGLYLRPVRLFLVANVVLFFALSFLQQNPLMGELAQQREFVGERGGAAVEERVEAWGGEAAVFEPLFNQRAGTLAGTLVGLFIPGIALLLAVVFGRSSAARHLTFAAHVVCALIGVYLLFVAVAFAVLLGAAVLGVLGGVLGPRLDVPLVVTVLGSISWYLARGARRVYGVHPARAWVGGVVVVCAGLPALIVGYRVLLFWLTLWTLDLPPV